MKIAFIAPAQSIHTQRWAAALTQRGHEVAIFSPYRESFGGGPSVPPILQHPPLLRRLRATFHRYSTVRRLILDLKPDIVHAHSVPEPWALPFLVGLTPLVISVWGSDVVTRQTWLRRLAYGLLFRRVALVTATSAYLAHVVAGYPFKPRAEVVPFGVDVDYFAPRSGPPDKKSGPVIGFLKHLESHYGPVDLIDAFAQVHARFPNARLVMAGDGSLRARLHTLVDQLGLAGLITFPGYIAHESVPDLMASFNLFAMPSHHESFGVAALEAAAMGLPVVATRVGGIPEVVQDGVTGLLIPPSDPSGLAAALCRLIEDPVLARQMGAAGREFVLNRYRWADCVSRMETWYASIR